MRKFSSYLLLPICLLCSCFSMVQAQLPSCTGSNNLIYLQTQAGPTPGIKIYNWDPTQPISASNPVLNTISLPIVMPYGWNVGDGLCVSNNLNSTTGPSPTFYTSRLGQYLYYNGTTWVNTGHTSGDASSGAGGSYIYSYEGDTVFRYDGTANAVPVTVILGTNYNGASDIVADCVGNFYILRLTPSATWLRKYNPSGTLLQEWTLNGATGQSAAFAIVNNILYYAAGGSGATSNIYSGVIGSGPTINISQLPGSIPYSVDFASCPATFTTSNRDTLFNCFADAPMEVTAGGEIGPYSCTVVQGTATITGSGPSFTVSSNEQVIVAMESSGACGKVYDTVLIMPAPVVNAGPDAIIHGCGSYTDTLHGVLTHTSSWINYNFNWSPNTTIIAGANTANPVIAPTANTTYSLTVTTDATQGNCTLSDDVLITVSDETISADFSFKVVPGCNEDIVTFANTSQRNTTNLWNFGDGLSDIRTNPVHAYTTQGKKEVTLTAGNDYCQDKVTHFVEIGTGNTWIRMPNAFSPNNDGLNDKFGPVINSWPQGYTMRMFNRWGEMIYVTYKEAQPWDGSYGGQPADAGIYYYTVTGECAVTGKPIEAKGEVILIR